MTAQALAHPPRTTKLTDSLGSFAPVPIAWREAVDRLEDAPAWTVAHRLLDIAGRWVDRWRWSAPLSALAEKLGAFVGCSARTFWRGWKRLRDAGLVEKLADGWAIAGRAGVRICLSAVEAKSVQCWSESDPVGGGGSEGIEEVSAMVAETVEKERVGERVVVTGVDLLRNQPHNQRGKPPAAEAPRPKPHRVLGYSVSTLCLREMPDQEIAELPSRVLLELGKPKRIPGSFPPRYEPRPDADELVDRLWGRSPERIREQKLAKREEERQEHERQKKIDDRRRVIGGQRDGFHQRWKDFVAYVEKRWGAVAMDKGYWSRRNLMPRLMEADARGTDELWDQAVKVVVERPKVSEPFAYLCAVLERLVEASMLELPPGEDVVAHRVLSAPSAAMGSEELLARWLDPEGGDK